MMDYKVTWVLLSMIAPALLYEAHRYPTPNRRNFNTDGLLPYYNSYAPYRYYPVSAQIQYQRPLRSTPKNDLIPSSSHQSKRTQRAPAPAPKYAKFTVDEASAGYLNLPHGFQNPIKPSGFQHGNLFSNYKYSPAAGHLPLNSLANYYGSGSKLGPVVYPETQTEKPIEEPLQEVPITPTPVSELTKAAVLHSHMFTSGSAQMSTEKPLESPEQNVEYEIKYVPVYVDENGKEVSNEELSNYKFKYDVDPPKYDVEALKYSAPAVKPTFSTYTPATSYKYENQKFAPTKYEAHMDSHENHDYPHYAPKYEFGYRVHDSYTGSDFGQSEHRDGEVTKGSYHVLLPDGRHQTVNYWSDDSGFHAKVKYDGVAKHYPTPVKHESVHPTEETHGIHS